MRLRPSLDWLLVLVPVSVALELAGGNELLVFFTSALAILPLAGLIGRSTEQLRRFYRLTAGALPLIGTGGVLHGADAYAKIRAGASALQVYTALVYRGPRTVVRILGELDRLLEHDGYMRSSDACGIDAGL